ncbi:MAG: AI-2E family transporter [Candidatus Latescibacteria bacterium]|nr:AI-2E family transporter [Candidatus Latescibacterota bacterium]
MSRVEKPESAAAESKSGIQAKIPRQSQLPPLGVERLEPPAVFSNPVKVVLGIALALALCWFLYFIRGILAPFVLAFIVAYVLTPLVDRMEGRGLNRTLSIVLVYLVVAGGMVFGGMELTQRLHLDSGELRDQFIPREWVDKQVSIYNARTSFVNLYGEWEEAGGRDSTFVLVQPEQWPLELPPGGQKRITLRFAPANPASAQAGLRLTSPTLEGALVLRLRGNSFAEEKLSPLIEFWDQGGYRQQVGLDSLFFSAGGIDFGAAGPAPAIILLVSEEVKKLPEWMQSLLGAGFDLAEWIRMRGGGLSKTLLGETGQVVSGLFSGIAFLAIVPFGAFFFLREGRRITHRLVELVPNAYFELVLNLIYQINAQIGGYLRGQLLATSVVAILSISALVLIGVPYSLPLGGLAGVANMIPYLGPLIGIVAASLVALATGGGLEMVWYIIIGFLVVQIIDNFLVQPAIMAKSVNLHPLIVLFVVLLGSHLMGIAGMLIAVPLTGILNVAGQTIFQGVKAYRAR